MAKMFCFFVFVFSLASASFEGVLWILSSFGVWFVFLPLQLPDKQILAIKSTISAVKKGIPIFYSRVKPSCFFEVKNPSCKLPLCVAHNIVVLCVSAIGFPESFVRVIRKVCFLPIIWAQDFCYDWCCFGNNIFDATYEYLDNDGTNIYSMSDLSSLSDICGCL